MRRAASWREGFLRRFWREKEGSQTSCPCKRRSAQRFVVARQRTSHEHFPTPETRASSVLVGFLTEVRGSSERGRMPRQSALQLLLAPRQLTTAWLRSITTDAHLPTLAFSEQLFQPTSGSAARAPRTLCILHGLMGSARNWSGFARRVGPPLAEATGGPIADGPGLLREKTSSSQPPRSHHRRGALEDTSDGSPEPRPVRKVCAACLLVQRLFSR